MKYRSSAWCAFLCLLVLDFGRQKIKGEEFYLTDSIICSTQICKILQASVTQDRVHSSGSSICLISFLLRYTRMKACIILGNLLLYCIY